MAERRVQAKGFGLAADCLAERFVVRENPKHNNKRCDPKICSPEKTVEGATHRGPDQPSDERTQTDRDDKEGRSVRRSVNGEREERHDQADVGRHTADRPIIGACWLGLHYCIIRRHVLP